MAQWRLSQWAGYKLVEQFKFRTIKDASQIFLTKHRLPVTGIKNRAIMQSCDFTDFMDFMDF
jgi:hypothetical protein